MVRQQPKPGSDDSELRLWLDEVDKSMDFRPASALGMSCGTVTIDPCRAMVLVIWNNRLKLYQLPKGRRNLDESMLVAALRETYEETGLHVTPLRLDVATRATPAKTQDSDTSQKPPNITEGHPSNEFVGACFYPDPQSETEALKIVYYFAATADCTDSRDSGTQEEWEKLDAKWIPLSEVPSTLRFAAEVDVVTKTVADMKRSGYAIGA
ncbi:NUDIX hydrolase domain-like protein [Chaetomium sp. MPI-SDFR-AT-0129]|uniref:NUDIX hydrolase domain-like protein n=1 Tax=Dichotomopilus funicola TaxID=1934379 RepID=A0AAN6ZQQ8_9PEZI|nr:NUDIX hydrolase domain-like protein [Chaetomium sp. MPI-SDFR-AT-0129]KAK4145701.1 NUDIX hydrolase domain-like protein [Dichotomopilus funicola]